MHDLFGLTEEISIECDGEGYEKYEYCQQIGLGAEYLVAADLCFSGYRVSIAAAGMPYDLICDIDGRPVRIQVKASGSSRTHNRGSSHGRARQASGYLFETRPQSGGNYYDKADILALVAVDTRCVLYMKVRETGRRQIVPVSMMTEEKCRLSLDQTISTLDR